MKNLAINTKTPGAISIGLKQRAQMHGVLQPVMPIGNIGDGWVYWDIYHRQEMCRRPGESWHEQQERLSADEIN